MDNLPAEYFYSGICFSWQHRCVAVRSPAYHPASSARGSKSTSLLQAAFQGRRSAHFFFPAFLLFILQSCSVSKQIAKQADKTLLQDSVIRTGLIGLSIFDPSANAYIYNYNADKYFVPASNTKLFTLYAALKYLGDSLAGMRYYEKLNQLYIIPTGDPTFLHPDFIKQPVFDFLLRHNASDIGIEFAKNVWKEKGYGNGWSWDDYEESYAARRSAFPVYGNIVRFKMLSDSILIKNENYNFPVEVQPRYFKSFIQPDVSACPLKYKAFTIERLFDQNKFFIKNAAKTPAAQVMPFNTDDATVSALLSDTLQSFFSKRAFSISGTEPDNETQKINTLYSRPTDSLLIPMMFNSDNFFAEQTLLMAGNKHLGYMNDKDIIDTLLNDDLKDISQKPEWVDGSGLSRYNLFTPQSFIYLLNKMKNEFGLERLKRMLPTGGQGTLKGYYTNDSTFIYAKTGTHTSISALSGFLITRKNRLLIFSILTNNYQGRATAVRRAMEKFITGIRKKY